MHTRDGMDKIIYEVKKIWKMMNANKKVTIGVIIVLIILIQLIIK
jgi:flagellar biosynthesis/type III secretory pathway M-ring protein FliF/YscJ